MKIRNILGGMKNETTRIKQQSKGKSYGAGL